MEDAGRSLLDVINDPDALNLFLESPGDGEVSASNGLCELDSLSPLLGTDPWSPTAPNPPMAMAPPMPAQSPQMGSVAPSPLGVAPSPSSSQNYAQAPSPICTSRTSSPLDAQSQILQQATQHLGLSLPPQQQITIATSPQVVVSQAQQITLGQSQQVSTSVPQLQGNIALGLGQQFIQQQQQPLMQQQITLASGGTTATTNVQPVTIQNVLQNVQPSAVQPGVVNLNLNQMRPITSTLQIRPQGTTSVPQGSVPGQVSLQGTIIQTANGNRILIQGQPMIPGQSINLAALQNLQQMQLRAPGTSASQAVPGQASLQNQVPLSLAATTPQTVNPVSVSGATASLGIQPAKVGATALTQSGVNFLNLGQSQGQQIMIQRPAGTGVAPNQNIILRTLPSNLIIQAPGAAQPQPQLAGQTQLLVGHPTQIQPGQIQIQPTVQQAASIPTTSIPTSAAQLPQQVQTITGQVLGMPSQGINLQQQIKTPSPVQHQAQNITLQNLGSAQGIGNPVQHQAQNITLQNLGSAQGIGNKSQSIQIQAQNVNIQGQNVNLLTPSHASTLQKGLLTGTIKVNVGGQNLTLQQIKQLGLPQLKGMNLVPTAGGAVQAVPATQSPISTPTFNATQLGVAGTQPQVLLSSQQPTSSVGTTSGQQITAQPTLIQGPGGIQQIVLQTAQNVVQQVQIPATQTQQLPTSDSHVLYPQLVKEEKPFFTAPSPDSAISAQSTYSSPSATPVASTQSTQSNSFECILSAAAAQSGLTDLLTPAENNVSAPQASATGATLSYKPAKQPSSEPPAPGSMTSTQQSIAQQSLQAPPNVNIQQVQLNSLMPTVNTIGPPNAVAPGVQIIPKLQSSQQLPKPAYQSIPTATTIMASSLSGSKLTVSQMSPAALTPQTSAVIAGSQPSASVALPQVSPVMSVAQSTGGISAARSSGGLTVVSQSSPLLTVSRHSTTASASPSIPIQSSPSLAPPSGAAPQVQTIQLTVANQQLLAKIQQQIKVLIAIPKRTDQQQKLLQQLAEVQKKILIHGRMQALQTQQQQIAQNSSQLVANKPQQQQPLTTPSPLASSSPQQVVSQQPQTSTQQLLLQQSKLQQPLPQQQTALPSSQQHTTAQQPLTTIQQPATSQHQPIIVQPVQTVPQQQFINQSQQKQTLKPSPSIPQIGSLQQSQLQQRLLQPQQPTQPIVQIVTQPSSIVQASGKPTVLLSAPVPITTVTSSASQRPLAPNLPKVLPNLTPKGKVGAVSGIVTSTAVLSKPQIQIIGASSGTPASTAVTSSAQKLIQIKPLLPGQLKPGDVKVTPVSQVTQVIAMATSTNPAPAVGKVLVAGSTVATAQGQPVKVSQIAIPTAIKEKLMAYLSRMTPEQQQVFLKNPQALVVKLQQAQLLKQQLAIQPQTKAGTLKPLLAAHPGGDATKSSKPQPMNKTTFILSQLGRDQREATGPDTKLAFKNRKDACKRLLRFHVYQDHNVDIDQEAKDDEQFEEVAQDLLIKKQQMLNKYRMLLFDEARRVEPTSEMVMLQRMFLNDERKVLEADRKLAKEDPEAFVPLPILTVASPSGSSSPIMTQAVIDTQTTSSPSSSPLHPSSSPGYSPTSPISGNRELKRKLDTGSAGWEGSPRNSNASPSSYTLHSSGGLKLVFKNSPSYLRSPMYTPPDIKDDPIDVNMEVIKEKKPKIKSEPMTPKNESWTGLGGYSDPGQEDEVKSEPPSPPSPIPHDSWGAGSPYHDASWEQSPEALHNGSRPDVLEDFLLSQPQEEAMYTSEQEPYSITSTTQVPFQGYSQIEESLDPREVQEGVSMDLSKADSSISSVVDIDSQGANEDASFLDTSQGDMSEEDSAVAGLLSDCGDLGNYSQPQETVSYSQPLETVMEEYEQPASTATYTDPLPEQLETELDTFTVDADPSVQHDHHRTSAYQGMGDLEGADTMGAFHTNGEGGHHGQAELENAVDGLMAGFRDTEDMTQSHFRPDALSPSEPNTAQPGTQTEEIVLFDSDEEELGNPHRVMMSSPLGFLDSSDPGISFDDDNLNVEMQSAINSILSLQQPSIPNRRVDRSSGSARVTSSATSLDETGPGIIMYEDISDQDTSGDMADDLDAAVQSIQFLM